MMFGEKDWVSLASFMAGVLEGFRQSGHVDEKLVEDIIIAYKKMWEETFPNEKFTS